MPPPPQSTSIDMVSRKLTGLATAVDGMHPVAAEKALIENTLASLRALLLTRTPLFPEPIVQLAQACEPSS